MSKSQNTRFAYLYRDACNYKVFNEIVISGILSFEIILPSLDRRVYFIPSVVGLDDIQPEPFSCDDHIWHEVESLTQTEDDATVNIDAQTLLRRFKEAHSRQWDEEKVFARKGIL
jgi:hypothetical protein